MKRTDSSACPPHDPLEDALEALLDGSAGNDDLRLIQKALKHDPEFRARYLALIETEAMIVSEFPAVDLPDWTGARQNGNASGAWRIGAGIAALLLVSLTAWWLAAGSRADPGQDGPMADFAFEADFAFDDLDFGPSVAVSAAKITRLDTHTATFEGTAATLGQRLETGLIECQDGSIDITFDSGAIVKVQGPASLRVESEIRATLLSGSLTAKVPEPAHGFEILTPSSFLRDLGTTFSVRVLDDEATDLHVLDGLVEAMPAGGGSFPPRLVRSNEAVRLYPQEIRTIEFDLTTLSVPIPEPTQPVPAVHWNFESWDGNRSHSLTGPHELEIFRHERTAEPTLVDGPFGNALAFDGDGLSAISNYPGVGGASARTVSFWIKLDPDVPGDQSNPNGILAWGSPQQSRKWQISWNTRSFEGTVGAPRVELGNGYLIGSTDLRNGRWHHIAVVFLGGRNTDVSTHVRIYVDGRLEKSSGRRQQIVATDTTSESARPLVLGRYLGTWDNRESFFYFHGTLDDVRVFETALLPSQVVGLAAR